MDDICKCVNEECPIRNKCYRFMAPIGGAESYAYFESEDCKYFMEIEGRKTKDIPKNKYNPI